MTFDKRLMGACLLLTGIVMMTSCGTETKSTLQDCQWVTRDEFLVLQVQKWVPNKDYRSDAGGPVMGGIRSLPQGKPVFLLISISDGRIERKLRGDESPESLRQLLGERLCAMSLPKGEVGPERDASLALMEQKGMKASALEVWVSPTRTYAACANPISSGKLSVYICDLHAKTAKLLRYITDHDLADAAPATEPAKQP